jgi:hypothetical protein
LGLTLGPMIMLQSLFPQIMWPARSEECLKKNDELVKSLFANDFEHFGVKAIEMFGVEKR